jgi:putative tricarboxylic transport membrane protein
MTARAPLHVGELLISLGLIALGTFVIWETRTIAETQAYAAIGPRLFPYVIGCGLTLCGAVLAWQAVAGGWRHVPLDEAHDAPDWSAFVIITAGVLLHMAIIGWAGFIIASTALFVLIARGFGSRRIVRDAVIGVVLAVVVFLIFTLALGLSLPKGPFNWG